MSVFWRAAGLRVSQTESHCAQLVTDGVGLLCNIFCQYEVCTLDSLLEQTHPIF